MMTTIAKNFLQSHYPELVTLPLEETYSRLHAMGKLQYQRYDEMLTNPDTKSISIFENDADENTPLENYMIFTSYNGRAPDKDAMNNMLHLFGYKQNIAFISEFADSIDINESTTMADVFSRKNEVCANESLVKLMDHAEKNTKDSSITIRRYRDAVLSTDDGDAVSITVAPLNEFYEANIISRTSLFMKHLGLAPQTIYNEMDVDSESYHKLHRRIKSVETNAIKKAVSSINSHHDMFFDRNNGKTTVFINDKEMMSLYTVEAFHYVVSKNIQLPDSPYFDAKEYYASKISDIDSEIMEKSKPYFDEFARKAL